MANDMMRFSVIRPFQKMDAKNMRRSVIASYAPTHNSAFYQGLKQDKDAGDRDKMMKRAQKYRADDPQFLKDLQMLKAPLLDIDAFLLGRESTVSAKTLEAEIDARFKAAGINNWKTWLKGPEFKVDLGRLHDSLIACSIAAEQDSAAKQLRPALVRAIRLTLVLRGIADGDKHVTAKNGVASALDALVMLPKELFPLPPRDNKKEKEESVKNYQAEKKVVEDQRQDLLKVLQELDNLGTAKTELNRVHLEVSRPEREKERDQRFKELEENESKGNGWLSRIFGGTNGNGFQPKPFTEKSTEWVLTPNAEKQLSPETAKTLGDIGAKANGTIDVRAATAEIETRVAAISERLHRAAPKQATVKIGNNFVSTSVLAPASPQGTVLIQPAPGTINIPVPVPGTPPLAKTPTVPAGKGNIRPLGYADLLVVREEIQKYEAGEVAHIENVLKGESNERQHKRKTEREVTLMTDTERSTESERDLQSTDRFELQATAQKELDSKLAVDAGVEATYSGGAYEIKADAGFAYERATKESSSKATTVAHEVTDRTVSRIRETVREQRTTTTREIIEETNVHKVVNSEQPKGHVIGVYRWVNTVHKAEVANYGRRLMFEVVVPEPAALFKYAEQNSPVPGTPLEKPEPPVYQATKLNPKLLFALNLDFSQAELRPLQPEDLDNANYLHWVAKYNVQDVEPPPPEFKIIGVSVTEKPTSRDNLVQKVNDLTVEAGYRAEAYHVSSSTIPHPEGYVRIGVGQRATAHNGPTDILMSGEDGTIPITVCYYNIAALAMTIEVSCRRTQEKYRAWQLKTYASIINAYNALKSAYDEQLAAAQIQAGVAIQGRNPLKNREIERTELKRAALSVITGQHFDLFDAMRDGASASQYPQMDLLESAAEGRYIQFFEQAFEWTALSYIFYPYFWGRKPRWVSDLHFTDPDPKFEKFLQAGAARVLIPVRPGYEHAIMHYLETETGEIWEGGDPPHVDDSLYVSIVDSIKEDQGNWNIEGPGELTVKKDDDQVSGLGTSFVEEDDENRDIVIRGKTYRILQVEARDTIQLDRPYEGKSESNVPYELGLKFMGEPWEVTVPTSLVWLQKGPELPDFTK